MDKLSWRPCSWPEHRQLCGPDGPGSGAGPWLLPDSVPEGPTCPPSPVWSPGDADGPGLEPALSVAGFCICEPLSPTFPDASTPGAPPGDPSPLGSLEGGCYWVRTGPLLRLLSAAAFWCRRAQLSGAGMTWWLCLSQLPRTSVSVATWPWRACCEHLARIWEKSVGWGMRGCHPWDQLHHPVAAPPLTCEGHVSFLGIHSPPRIVPPPLPSYPGSPWPLLLPAARALVGWTKTVFVTPVKGPMKHTNLLCLQSSYLKCGWLLGEAICVVCYWQKCFLQPNRTNSLQLGKKICC